MNNSVKIILGVAIAIVIALSVVSIRSNSSLNNANKKISLYQEKDSLRKVNIAHLESSLEKSQKLATSTLKNLADEKLRSLAYADTVNQVERKRRNQVYYFNKQIRGLKLELTESKSQFAGLQRKYDDKTLYFQAELATKDKRLTMQEQVIEDLTKLNLDLESTFPKNEKFADLIAKKTLRRSSFKGFKEKNLLFDNDAMNGFIFIMPERKLKRVIKPFITEDLKDLTPIGAASKLLQK